MQIDTKLLNRNFSLFLLVSARNFLTDSKLIRLSDERWGGSQRASEKETKTNAA